MRAPLPPFKPLPLKPPAVDVERRADGCILLRSRHAPGPSPRSIAHLLQERAAQHPHRPWMKQRLPGHGPGLRDPVAVLDGYLGHRRARLAEVEEVVRGGVTDAPAIVAIVYADVPREVWPAAELTVRAQLDYLNSR